jgi:hypothetical protein
MTTPATVCWLGVYHRTGLLNGLPRRVPGTAKQVHAVICLEGIRSVDICALSLVELILKEHSQSRFRSDYGPREDPK